MEILFQQIVSGLATGGIYGSVALALADHAYLLETGRVVMSGPAADLQRDESIRRSYLGY